MNRLLLIVISLAAVLGPWLAACPTYAADQTVAATSTSGLVIVPFAVPVAVPVAVVQQPTLFYGVAASAQPAATTPVATTPVASTASVASNPTTAPAADDPLRAQVAALLQRRCAECHRGATSQGNLMLFDADARLLEKLPRQLIVEQATTPDGTRPTMPPGDRAPLTVDEQALVRRWATVPKRLSY